MKIWNMECNYDFYKQAIYFKVHLLGRSLVNDSIKIPNNKRMLQLPQNVDLGDNLTLLFLRKILIVHLLTSHLFTIALPANLGNTAK